MRELNVAIIGYGWAGSAHITAVNATGRARVIALYSSRQHDPAELARRHGCSLEVFEDLAAMLRQPDLDVVSICSRPDLQLGHLTAVARAGKHFIVEKPVALSPEDVRAAARVVRSAGPPSFSPESSW
jgi:UDP-N-acetyl-2-amino-2-deoxyglucuronate dehydrogenase